TIDGADAKDLDDAISLKMGDEGYELGVHIADVSHYAPEGSRLDREALGRGTSVYLVDRVIPMFPPELSNQIASLNPGEKRLTVSCFVVVSTDGRILRSHFHESVIESRHRLTYDAVNRVLAGEAVRGLEGIQDWLREAQKLADLLHRRRMERGAVDFDLPEAKVRLNPDGHVAGIDLRERGPAERLIEEFMLLANEAVATHLTEKDLPVLYRVHESPAEEKLTAFREMLGALGHRLPDPITPKALQGLLATVRGRPEERVVTEALLRSMRQARYAAANLGHFGLASQCYTHFTSPIRRYPDLFVHRVLKAHLRHQDTPEHVQAWRDAAPGVAEQASTRERVAMDAERQSVLVKQIEYMVDKIGETYGGVISGVTSFGLFVELDNLVEGLVRIEDLPADHYDFDPVHYTLSGSRRGTRYRLGDRVSVDVVRVDQQARRIDFRLSDTEDRAPKVHPAPKTPAAGRRPGPRGTKRPRRRRPA
ncbi:MAG: ribonuclease R family protein, partial [Clostridia bacterium]